MKRLVSLLTVVISIILCSSVSFAAGFLLPDQDSAAMGMAGAFAGQADNAATVWYNPAGMTQLDGTRISGGVIGIYPVLTHESNTGTTDVSSRDIHLPVHFYATHRMNDAISFGVSINNPFGLSTDWDQNTSSTKYVATYSKVVTVEVNPNIAYKLNDSASVAFGVAYVHLSATLEKTVSVILPGPILLGDHNFRLSGDGDGWGLNAAVLYKISPNVHAGLSYRSRIKIDVDGDLELTGGPAATSATGQTSITLPDLVQLGVSYKASEKLLLNADLDYTMWSTYDRIVITSGNPLFNTTDEKQWHDVWCLRIGGQYRLADQWKLRAGYVYDKNPIGESRFDTRTPDADRQGVTIGAGYAFGNATVDLAYMYLRFNSRTISNSLADNDPNPLTPDDSLNGTYKSRAHLAGITVGYKF
ncbi:MAG: OmpP1/FadL family transporter [Nitrospirota bacterium]